MTARLLMVAIQPRKGGECLASITMAGYSVSISTDQGGGSGASSSAILYLTKPKTFYHGSAKSLSALKT